MSRAAQLMGRRGGKRSLQTMTPEERKARARKAGIASGKARRKKAKGRRATTDVG